MLLQPTDTLFDVQAVFGPLEGEFLYPPDLSALERDAVPNPNPLRVLRVRPR